MEAEKTKDYSVALHHIKESTIKNLYTLKVEETEKCNTVLRIDKMPRYLYDEADEPPEINLNMAAIFGDLFAAVCALTDMVKQLEKKIDEHEKKCYDTEYIDKATNHIKALENNLRCLRETLTYNEP